MYSDIFTNNFILNFFISTIFIIFNVIFSYSISRELNKKKIFLLNEFQPIIIFFLVFTLYLFALNIIIFTNLYDYFRLIFFIIVFLQIIYVLKNIHDLINFDNLKTKLSIQKKIILFFLFLFFLISILPISDADSISVMQNVATVIYQQGLVNINLNKDIEFTSILGTEMLLIISPILNSDNFGTQLNLFVLIFFMICKIKDNQKFFLIILSSPLIIYFISTPKLQLFFGILYLVLFIIINQNLIKNKLDLFITIILLTFYASGKTSYILLAAPLYFYLFLKNISEWKNIILYSLISFLIILLPIFITKQIYFGNFFAPFYDEIIGKNNELYNGYALSLRSSQGWLMNYLDYKIYLKPFVPLNINELSISLGFIFLLMLTDLKLLKKTKFIPLIIIIMILLTGQILPRYYFEAFLILAFYYNSKNILFNPLIIIQSSIVLFISVVYVYIAYIDSKVLIDRSAYMKRFSYSYYDAGEIKKMNLSGNILDISQGRQSIFFNKNLYSFRNISVQNLINKNDKLNIINYIKNNLINYIIIDNPNNLPSCLELKKTGETYRKTAVRNFLRKTKKSKFHIYYIVNNKC
jgi:hypothetical protein